MNVSDFDRLKETTLKQTYHFRGRIINLRVDDVALSDGSSMTAVYSKSSNTYSFER